MYPINERKDAERHGVSNRNESVLRDHNRTGFYFSSIQFLFLYFYKEWTKKERHDVSTLKS